MKKLLSTVLCASLLSINLASFANETKQVSIETEPASLNSKILKKQYSAYKITYTNKRQNPLLINNIHGDNLVGDLDKINASAKYSKGDYVMQALGIPTLGITTVINMFVKLNNIQKSGEEAVKYANTQLIRAKNEVVMPQQAVTYFVLVPLNQTPNMTAIFEDTKTHEYIGVDTSN